MDCNETAGVVRLQPSFLSIYLCRPIDRPEGATSLSLESVLSGRRNTRGRISCTSFGVGFGFPDALPD
jgi:hypothetical protein